MLITPQLKQSSLSKRSAIKLLRAHGGDLSKALSSFTEVVPTLLSDTPHATSPPVSPKPAPKQVSRKAAAEDRETKRWEELIERFKPQFVGFREEMEEKQKNEICTAPRRSAPVRRFKAPEFEYAVTGPFLWPAAAGAPPPTLNDFTRSLLSGTLPPNYKPLHERSAQTASTRLSTASKESTEPKLFVNMPSISNPLEPFKVKDLPSTVYALRQTLLPRKQTVQVAVCTTLDAAKKLAMYLGDEMAGRTVHYLPDGARRSKKPNRVVHMCEHGMGFDAVVEETGEVVMKIGVKSMKRENVLKTVDGNVAGPVFGAGAEVIVEMLEGALSCNASANVYD